nr:MAG TPA: hypothetical protein [Caudoviricetes sp.]
MQEVERLFAEKKWGCVMKYRKKPVEVDAFRYRIDPVPKWFYDAMENGVVTFFGPVLQYSSRPDRRTSK